MQGAAGCLHAGFDHDVWYTVGKPVTRVTYTHLHYSPLLYICTGRSLHCETLFSNTMRSGMLFINVTRFWDAVHIVSPWKHCRPWYRTADYILCPSNHNIVWEYRVSYISTTKAIHILTWLGVHKNIMCEYKVNRLAVQVNTSQMSPCMVRLLRHLSVSLLKPTSDIFSKTLSK